MGNPQTDQRFNWTRFYAAIADKILDFQGQRDQLISGIHDIASRVDAVTTLTDKFADGSSAPLDDICPFTTLGIFNRQQKDYSRNLIATELAKFLEVTEPIPSTFAGIPVVGNQGSWFFGYHKEREPGDIDTLWDFFSRAIAFADLNNENSRTEFVAAYDNALRCKYPKWNLTMGLYWIRPWFYLSLDRKSRSYISNVLHVQIDTNSPKKCCNANDYLRVLNRIKSNFQEDSYNIHSLPELALVASQLEKGGESTKTKNTGTSPGEEENNSSSKTNDSSLTTTAYSIECILNDGCFLEKERIELILKRLQSKKNLILQGPPGTGKTWLAKRLAFALLGERNSNKVRPVQFHPNLSYEDFVRGWRPSSDGNLSLVDGPFLQMIEAANNDHSSKHVIVIEEINRGNPAQIFGEMLTLLDADKRSEDEALELTYPRFDERVFIPDNLYVIGTMNIADRSLALVDLALRRRFAFVNLEPAIGKTWRNWVHKRCGVDLDVLVEIERRFTNLNSEISNYNGLGPQFQVGHSYVTPSPDDVSEGAWKWFQQVVETEIAPLLDEYLYDDLEKSEREKRNLLKEL